jgi:hypothetical protein
VPLGDFVLEELRINGQQPFKTMVALDVWSR